MFFNEQAKISQKMNMSEEDNIFPRMAAVAIGWYILIGSYVRYAAGVINRVSGWKYDLPSVVVRHPHCDYYHYSVMMTKFGAGFLSSLNSVKVKTENA